MALLLVIQMVAPVGGRPLAASERVTRQLLQNGTGDGGFLAGDLPLEIVATTPADLAGNGRVEVTGQQALTVSVQLATSGKSRGGWTPGRSSGRADAQIGGIWASLYSGGIREKAVSDVGVFGRNRWLVVSGWRLARPNRQDPSVE